MPNCDFFAYGSDHEIILEYLFDVMHCRIFELASRPGREVMEFKTLRDFEEHFSISDWDDDDHTPLLLQVLPRSAKGKVEFQRIDHEDGEWDDSSFRYRTRGLGLIQLYLSGIVNGELRQSHTNHNTNKRAVSIAESDEVDSWDWGVVTSFSRKLNRYIKRLCVRQQRANPVLLRANDILTNAE